ncbi:TIGR02265 family protein [Myxococcaceae bacterium JPH2]|nr:TIGR02265 family protein [Myxococcaceae bacterium JPH2]
MMQLMIEEMNRWQDQELRLRLDAAKSDDTTRGIYFIGVLDMVKGLGGEAEAQLCRGACGELRFSRFGRYPVTRFLQLTHSAAYVLAPHCGGYEEAMRRMGAQAVLDCLTATSGFNFLMAYNVLGAASGSPRRLVDGLPGAYLRSVSYGERHVLWTTARSARLFMRRDFMPVRYHEGVLQTALESVGARGVEVRGHRTSLLDCEYTLSWAAGRGERGASPFRGAA